MKSINISKKMGCSIFSVVALAIIMVVILRVNPDADKSDEMLKKILTCTLIMVGTICFIIFYDKITSLPVELYQNKELIWKLAKNDFKKRYAGSYLGMLWALIQPVVTVLMYWIVFDLIGMNRGEVEVPFVLFLTAGLVPWFFFSEAFINGTQAMLEYNYLVKKVVFKISILPIIKIISAIFIHLFFVLVLFVVAFLYGYYPSVYTIQIVYYSICAFIFVLALSYSTCAIVVFFRDLSQIINILLQVGMWATPILWDMDILSEKMLMVIKLNPVVYIVNGYRMSIYGSEWFWHDFYSTMYFWVITAILFGIGALIFKQLKVHFADVL